MKNIFILLFDFAVWFVEYIRTCVCKVYSRTIVLSAHFVNRGRSSACDKYNDYCYSYIKGQIHQPNCQRYHLFISK